MSYIYNLFGTVLSWFNSITGSYAVALILYALAFKILFLPFSLKQQKNQIAMAKLRPKIAKIEKKYAGRNDTATRQKMQQEIMELQSQEGYSPLSGCLPLLLQFPIIIFLYNVIRNPLTYISKFSAEVITNVKTAIDCVDLTDEIAIVDKIKAYLDAGNTIAVDGFNADLLPNFDLLGVNLAATPTLSPFTILALIPILAAAFQWLSMVLMRKFQGNAATVGQDAQNNMSMKMMDLLMPLMTLFFAFKFSGMLGLYWIYQSILGVLQSYVLAKIMPLPTFTAEELREIEKAEKEKAKMQREVMNNDQVRYKSLHHIDDDDYDTLPELKSDKAGEGKKTSGIEGAALKNDKKNDN